MSQEIKIRLLGPEDANTDVPEEPQQTPAIRVSVDEAGLPVVELMSEMDAQSAAMLLIAAAQVLHGAVEVPEALDVRAQWVRVAIVPPRVVVPGTAQQSQLQVSSNCQNKMQITELLMQPLLPQFQEGMMEMQAIIAQLQQGGRAPQIFDPRRVQ